MYPIERYIIPERGLAMEILGIGDRLRTLRTHRKMTIKQVSERLGISASVLSEYQLDVKNPSYRNLLRFARLYNVSCDYLLGNEECLTLNVAGLTEEEIGTISELISLFQKSREG